MMNWSEYEQEERKQERCYVRRIVIAVLLGGLIAAGVIGYAKRASAAPMFSATNEGITITLTDEPCALEAVSNLKYRATWVEKDNTFEGCWAPHREMGVVIAYFDDKTVAIIPVQAFAKVTGA